MRIIIGILIFYKKLVIPSLAVALALNFPEWIFKGVFPIGKILGTYVLTSFCFHYFIYEKRNSYEYYFYYNMGLSKYLLWGMTLFLSLIFASTMGIIWVICT